MPDKVSYSWQSDRPNKTNRRFIEDAGHRGEAACVKERRPMTGGSDRGSCRFHDAHAARAALRGAGTQAWDAWLVCRVGEGATPALVCPECVDLADVVVAECPLVGDETAEYVCRRCAAPIRKAEAVLYP